MTGAPVAHLNKVYPKLRSMFRGVGEVALPPPAQLSVPDAVVATVIGQMLSRQAAATIHKRLQATAFAAGAKYCWELPHEMMRECGLSQRKARTIKEFGAAFSADPQQFQKWREIGHEELRSVIAKLWGLSEWSADMISIFHFQNPDVFPITDGTIKRSVKLVQQYYLPEGLNVERASPYRTTLALYLWASIDRKFWPLKQAAALSNAQTPLPGDEAVDYGQRTPDGHKP